MKVKVTDPKGILVGETRVAKGDVVEIGGGQLKAYLHFKQVVPAEGEEAGVIKNPPAGTKADNDRAAAEKAAALEKEKQEKEAAEKAAAVQDFQTRLADRGQKLSKLNRKEQVKILESLGLAAVKDAKENELVEQILVAEFGKEKEALGL